jgi:AcrR family transcriptional regulator
MAVETSHLRADARRNRERIVAAAAECFATDGIDCQVAEIARVAGVGNATVFRHFSTKHDLLAAVIEAKMGSMFDAADAADAVGDAGDALRLFLEALMRLHVEDNGLKQVVAAQFIGDERLVAMRDEVLGRLTRLVDAAKAAGAVRSDAEPIDFAVLVNGVATAVMGLEDQRPGLYRRYFEIALAGMRPQQPGGAPLPESAPTPDELDAAFHCQAGVKPPTTPR